MDLTKILSLITILLLSTYSNGQKVEELIEQANNTNDISNKCDIYLSIAKLYQQKAAYSDAIIYAQKAAVLSRKIGDIHGESIAYNLIAISYLRLGEYQNCLDYQDKALKIAKQRGDKKDIAASYNNIGNIYTMQGKYKNALPLHLEALKLSIEISDLEGIATSHGNAGNVYFYMKDYAQTRYHYKASQKVYESVGALIGVMIIEINIGNIYLEEGDYDKALDCFLRALKMNDVVDNLNLTADNYINIATTYRMKKDYDKALEFALLAIESKKAVKDKNGTANAYNILGSIYMDIDNNPLALLNLKQGLVLARELGSLNFQKESLENLYQIHEKLGHFDSAYFYHKHFQSVRDSLESLSMQEIISDLKLKYETEKKDVQIQLLTRDKAFKAVELRNILAEAVKKEQAFELIRNEKLLGDLSLKLREEELVVKDLDIQRKDNELEIVQLENDLKQASLIEEKSKRQTWIIVSVLTLLLGSISAFFFYQKRKNAYQLSLSDWELKTLRNQMKPHFIFNALNSINNYIAKNESVQASSYLIQFSKLIRKTLNNAASDLISLEEELEAAKTLIELEKINIDQKLIYSFEIQEDIELEDIRVPSLILQPFIENAIWHGIAPKNEVGKIILRIQKIEDNLFVEIEDNGVGRNQSSQNTSRHSSQSFGLKITEERLQLLSKTFKKKFAFHFEDLNPGLKVIIQMPYLGDFG